MRFDHRTFMLCMICQGAEYVSGAGPENRQAADRQLPQIRRACCEGRQDTGGIAQPNEIGQI